MKRRHINSLKRFLIGQACAVIAVTCLVATATQASGQVASHSSGKWEESLSEAVEESRRTEKPILLFFSGSDWCYWCQRLDEEVIETREFAKWSDASVVKMKLDFPQSYRLDDRIAVRNERLKQRFESYVTGFPTVLAVNYRGEVLGQFGYEQGGAANWIAKVDRTLKSSRQRTAESGSQ